MYDIYIYVCVFIRIEMYFYLNIYLLICTVNIYLYYSKTCIDFSLKWRMMMSLRYIKNKQVVTNSITKEKKAYYLILIFLKVKVTKQKKDGQVYKYAYTYYIHTNTNG